MTDYMRLERRMCQDCGHDTKTMEELYMVYHDVWELALRLGGAHMLCVGCLELRLSRKLCSRDFMKFVPLNWDWARYPKSLRLRQRMMRSHDIQKILSNDPDIPWAPSLHRTHDDRMMIAKETRDFAEETGW